MPIFDKRSCYLTRYKLFLLSFGDVRYIAQTCMLLKKKFAKFKKGTKTLKCRINLRKTGNILRYKAFLSLKNSTQYIGQNPSQAGWLPSSAKIRDSAQKSGFKKKKLKKRLNDIFHFRF